MYLGVGRNEDDDGGLKTGMKMMKETTREVEEGVLEVLSDAPSDHQQASCQVQQPAGPPHMHSVRCHTMFVVLLSLLFVRGSSQ